MSWLGNNKINIPWNKDNVFSDNIITTDYAAIVHDRVRGPLMHSSNTAVFVMVRVMRMRS